MGNAHIGLVTDEPVDLVHRPVRAVQHALGRRGHACNGLLIERVTVHVQIELTRLYRVMAQPGAGRTLSRAAGGNGQQVRTGTVAAEVEATERAGLVRLATAQDHSTGTVTEATSGATAGQMRSGEVVATTTACTARPSAEASARAPALIARSSMLNPSLTIRRSLMPVRDSIHSGVVSSPLEIC